MGLKGQAQGRRAAAPRARVSFFPDRAFWSAGRTQSQTRAKVRQARCGRFAAMSDTARFRKICPTEERNKTLWGARSSHTGK